MRRRQFLASGTALLPVALAGCAHPTVVLDMNEATAGDIAETVSATAEPGSEKYRLVETAIENGSATRRGRYALFERTSIVRVDGAFYNVTETRLERSEVTVYEVLLDFNPADTTPTRGKIEFAELPAVDRQRLAPMLSGDDPPLQEGYDVGIGYGTLEDVGNESVFVPTREYDVLVYEGEPYRVAVNTRTASTATYRYSVTEVASSVDALAERVRDAYLFTLSARSDAERDVIENAIESGYYEDTDAFRSVISRIQDHEAITRDDFYGTWLLEYDGVEYLTYAEW